MADLRHVMPCDEGSRGFIVVTFCSAILHHCVKPPFLCQV
ncbi:hypothetical protein K661_02690 [Piscirickettsia salmonis LF-89 = ATCC VR-1361]|nr:hypothetical protein K661_02690 [Piscirickettsia salmonis LF-89 = ATCC VR-1361]